MSESEEEGNAKDTTCVSYSSGVTGDDDEEIELLLKRILRDDNANSESGFPPSKAAKPSASLIEQVGARKGRSVCSKKFPQRVSNDF